MSTRILARPTAPRLPHMRTATPGGKADYQAPGSTAELVGDLAAYGVAEPAEPRGEWEAEDWDCLARLAGA
jgi:hypothetical protein